MKNTKSFKAKFIHFNSVKAKSCGGTGYLDVYWFEIEHDHGYVTVLPYILDYTAMYDRKLEYLFVIQPLESYRKNSHETNLIGTVCFVKALMDSDDCPIRIESIERSKSN